MPEGLQEQLVLSHRQGHTRGMAAAGPRAATAAAPEPQVPAQSRKRNNNQGLAKPKFSSTEKENICRHSNHSWQGRAWTGQEGKEGQDANSRTQAGSWDLGAVGNGGHWAEQRGCSRASATTPLIEKVPRAVGMPVWAQSKPVLPCLTRRG